MTLALFAGCGGEEGPTLEKWAAEANAACARAEEEVRDVEAPGTLDEVAAYVEATAPVVERQLEELRALERPPEHEERIGEFLDRVEETVEAARETGAAAARRDEAGAREAGRRAQAATGELRSLARELGAEECATQGR